MKDRTQIQISLRPLRRSDAETCYENLRHRVYHLTASLPYPYTLEMARAFIRRCHLTRRKGTDEVFAIVDNECGNMLGMVGIHEISKRNRRAEIGYWIARSAWNTGIASAAVTEALVFCFIKLRLQRVYAHVFRDNVASQRVLEKNGFVREGLLRRDTRLAGKYVDTYVFAILRDEWRARRRPTPQPAQGKRHAGHKNTHNSLA